MDTNQTDTLLTDVAEFLRSHAAAVDALYEPEDQHPHTDRLRVWAERLERKAALEAAAGTRKHTQDQEVTAWQLQRNH